MLEEAVTLDPNFARAFSKLGDLHALTPDYLNIDNRIAEEAATANARRALALQPNLVEPRAVLGQVHIPSLRFREARAEYEQALAIDAHDLTANLWYAIPEFARKMGYAALWDQYGPPDLCRKEANGDYRCE